MYFGCPTLDLPAGLFELGSLSIHIEFLSIVIFCWCPSSNIFKANTLALSLEARTVGVDLGLVIQVICRILIAARAFLLADDIGCICWLGAV